MIGCGGGGGSSSTDNTLDSADIPSTNVDNNDTDDEVVACNTDNGLPEADGGIQIRDIDIDMFHYHPSYYSQRRVLPLSPMGFNYAVSVRWADSDDDMIELVLLNKTSGVSHFIKDRRNTDSHLPKEEFYVEKLGMYAVTYTDQLAVDRVTLRDWKVIATSSKGYVVCKDFDLILPTGEEASDGEFIYSYAYAGTKQGGHEGLDVMTRAKNSLALSSNPGSQSFRVEFQNTDSRAKHYSIVFYNNARDFQIGRVSLYSSSIESTPITQGQKTVVDIPWSEIIFNYNFSASDVRGVHIRLYNEPVPVPHPVFISLDDHNYRSISEYVTF